MEGATVVQKSSSHLKILSPERDTLNKFYTGDPQIVGATIVSRETWRVEFVRLWLRLFIVKVKECVEFYRQDPHIKLYRGTETCTKRYCMWVLHDFQILFMTYTSDEICRLFRYGEDVCF
jgi:hypothetical protein